MQRLERNLMKNNLQNVPQSVPGANSVSSNPPLSVMFPLVFRYFHTEKRAVGTARS